MSISQLLEPGSVVSNVEARSKKHTLEILSELLASGEHDIVAGEIFESLVQRERLGSTGLGSGIAIPHGRVRNLDASVGAFVKLSEPTDFDAPDDEPVDLVFAILVPEDASDEHLETLSEIALRFRGEHLADDLREINSSKELYERLIDSDPPPPDALGLKLASGSRAEQAPAPVDTGDKADASTGRDDAD